MQQYPIASSRIEKCTMRYSIMQAARAVGRNRTTILRAIKSGKLSAQLIDDAYRIDPAELHRVYPVVAAQDANASQSINAHRDEHHHAQALELAALRAENVLLRESLDDARRRLDTETEERRRLTHVLEDMRAQTAPGARRERRWPTWVPAAILLAMLAYVAYTVIVNREAIILAPADKPSAPAVPQPPPSPGEIWKPDSNGG